MEQIIGYEGLYEIHLTGTDDGQPAVWRCDKGRYKKQYINTNGRKFVHLWKNNNEEHRSIHQLVAEHFVNPPDTRHRTVDHINGDYLDNRVQNLRWLTPAEQEINKPGNLGYDWNSAIPYRSKNILNFLIYILQWNRSLVGKVSMKFI